MQPTFLFTFILPPPTAGPEILPLPYGACAWRASNTWKSLVMQWVIGNIIDFGIVPHIVQRPIIDGVELDELVATIPLHLCHALPVIGLLRTDTGNPAFCAFKRSL